VIPAGWLLASSSYIAGSSVFPTVGFVNPTVTIVALALRLADHVSTD
jgi:choline dehydrogenase-like flavoprotein